MVAIFGDKGYLGGELAYYLRSKGVPFDGFDRESDVTTNEFWQEFNPRKYSTIYYLSGLTGTEVGFTQADKFLIVNELGLLNLLSAIIDVPYENRPKIIFPSTRLVYKGSNNVLSEDAEKETKTPYAVNKLACEGYLAAFSNRYGINYSVLRICVPYGSLREGSSYSYGTLGFFKREIDAGRPITLYGGGLQRRTFTHVHDICVAFEKLSQSTLKSVVCNIGGEDFSLREVAEKFIEKYGGEIVDAPWPEIDRKLESGSTVFDDSLLRSLTDWKTTRQLVECL